MRNLRGRFFKLVTIVGFVLCVVSLIAFDGDSITMETAIVNALAGLALLYIGIFIGGEDVTGVHFEAEPRRKKKHRRTNY